MLVHESTIKAQIMVIMAHPRQNNFNHALANQVVDRLSTADRQVRFHNLHAEQFDPLLRLEEAYTSSDRASTVASSSGDPLL